jgi:hypothetical protein
MTASDLLLIYVSFQSPRLQYIMEVMMCILLRQRFLMTNSLEEYKNYEGIKFAYTNENMAGLRFGMTQLLQEVDIRHQNLETVEWKNFNLAFGVPTGAALPFDPFALSFYLISRYEEYQNETQKDEHGRYKIQNSFAYINGFHRKPLVNIIALEIGKLIAKEFPRFLMQTIKFKEIDTYDVDIAYQYRGKTLLRWTGALAKAILKRDTTKAVNLLKTIAGKKVIDPFDTFARHRERAEQSGNKPIHFFLTAAFTKYDRNINYRSPLFRNLVNEIADFSEVGIHPSYYSSEKIQLIQKEKENLEYILNQSITKSRQHFLRFSLPQTFQELIRCGITDDYSLGWTHEVGFRASIAIAYPFYELRKNEKTNLILHPLCLMDRALERVSPYIEEQTQIMRQLLEDVQNVGGEWVILRHNSF